MPKRLLVLFSAFLLAGCFPAPAAVEQRLSSLESEVRLLREENRALRERVLELELARAAPGAPDVSGAASASAAPAARLAARCVKRGDKYLLSRADADQFYERINDVALEVRIIPNFKDGQATGFRLFGIRPDSFVSSCGLQNGDIVSHVNGHEISSPDKALEAYSKVRDARRVELAIERQGKKQFILIDAE